MEISEAEQLNKQAVMQINSTTFDEVTQALQTPQLAQENIGQSTVNGKRIFVGNLSVNTSWQDLKDFFRQAGDVVYAQVYQAIQGRTKQWGIVQFRSFEEAQKAIKTLNRGTIDGREITVREDREEAGQEIQTQGLGRTLQRQGRGRGQGRAQRGYRGAYERGIQGAYGGDYGRNPLYGMPQYRYGYGYEGHEDYGGGEYGYGYDAYHPYGYAYSARMREYPSGYGRGRGRGRVSGQGRGAPFKSREQNIEYDVEYDRNYGYGGEEQMQEMQQGQTQVVVHGLPYRFSWQDLKDLFGSEILDVQHADIQMDIEGRSKGYGTVKFRSPEGASEAIEKFNKYDLNGRLLTVKFDKFAY